MEQVHIGTTNYGSHWLEPLAAASWARMVRDGCPAEGITDAGRTNAEQVTLFTKHFTTNYNASAKFDQRTWNGQKWWRAYRPGTKKAWPSAATPGSTQARHTYGRALDLNGATRAWVRAHGHRYGWIKDIVSGEDWHMEYQPGRDVFLTGAVSEVRPPVFDTPDITPPTNIEERDQLSMSDITAILQALQGIQATCNNLESILTVQGGNGIRGDVQDVKGIANQTRADVGTVANEVRALSTALGHPIQP